MIRYYCSGFDPNNAFGHGLGDMFQAELKKTKSIVYIPGGSAKIEKVRNQYLPRFSKYFENVGIIFDEVTLITPDSSQLESQEKIKNADFIMLMGGNPFEQKKMCNNLGLLPLLKDYDGLMLGFSAGAMFMSRNIIITPCSDEYPDFRIEEGLNLDKLSIYPHSNTSSDVYPETLVVGDETYKRDDFITVAKKYGSFYLLQDNIRDDGFIDVSIIKSVNGDLEFYTENEGKIWNVNDKIMLIHPKQVKNKNINSFR